MLAIAATLLASCGGSDNATSTGASTSGASGTFPADVEARYLSNCERTARASSNSTQDFSQACGCTLRYLEAHETVAQFEADEQTLSRNVEYPPVFRQAILACRDQTPGG